MLSVEISPFEVLSLAVLSFLTQPLTTLKYHENKGFNLMFPTRMHHNYRMLCNPQQFKG